MAGVAVVSPMYRPAMRVVDSITNAENAVITTTFDHGYLSGTYVRLYIPVTYGMQQAQHATGPITVTGDTTFTMDLNTSTFDAFAVPSPQYQYAQVVPIGELNSMLTAAFQNVL